VVAGLVQSTLDQADLQIEIRNQALKNDYHASEASERIANKERSINLFNNLF
jgi:hypothetical protein